MPRESGTPLLLVCSISSILFLSLTLVDHTLLRYVLSMRIDDSDWSDHLLSALHCEAGILEDALQRSDPDGALPTLDPSVQRCRNQVTAAMQAGARQSIGDSEDWARFQMLGAHINKMWAASDLLRLSESRHPRPRLQLHQSFREGLTDSVAAVDGLREESPDLALGITRLAPAAALAALLLSVFLVAVVKVVRPASRFISQMEALRPRDMRGGWDRPMSSFKEHLESLAEALQTIRSRPQPRAGIRPKELAIDALPDPVLLVRSNGRVSAVNGTFLWPGAASVPLSELPLPEATVARVNDALALRELRSQDPAATIEVTIDGQRRRVWPRVFPVVSPDDVRAVIVLSDVSAFVPPAAA